MRHTKKEKVISDPLSAMTMKYGKVIGSDGRNGRLLREGDHGRLSDKVSFEPRLDLFREPAMLKM